MKKAPINQPAKVLIGAGEEPVNYTNDINNASKPKPKFVYRPRSLESVLQQIEKADAQKPRWMRHRDRTRVARARAAAATPDEGEPEGGSHGG